MQMNWNSSYKQQYFDNT